MTELYEHIEQRITALKDGDFRQDLILQHWKALAERCVPVLILWLTLCRFPDKCFQTVTINASVSHGTYIRSISNDLGKALNTGATVIDLLRTSVSTFRLQNSIQLTPTQHPLNKWKQVITATSFLVWLRNEPFIPSLNKSTQNSNATFLWFESHNRVCAVFPIQYQFCIVG